jgi:acetyl esterase/lipase
MLRSARRVLAAASAVALVSLAACSGAATLNALAPTGGVAIRQDVAYRPGARGRLDIYQPTRADGRAPVVVFLYGGGWDSGRKADYRFVGAALARQGFVVMAPDYRIYPQVRWPAFLEDSAQAVAWAHAHASIYGGDPERLFVMGHSAGAYNAVMLAVDPRWLAADGLDPKRDLAGCIGLAGPYDFLPLHSERLKIIFGPPERLADTQPVNKLDGPPPPLFLATDAGDKVVDPGHTTRMAARVRANGGQVEVRQYPGLSHALLIGAVSPPLRFLAPVLGDVSDFIRRQAESRP